MPVRKRRRRRKEPRKALRVTTCERLGDYLRAFAQGHFHLMILVGAGGLAKSRSVRSVLCGKACWIEGNATPFGMYAKLYRHRDEFVVIDDVDSLYADRSGVRLLKCLCQTEDDKTVAWHSDARSLERQRIRASSRPSPASSSSRTTGRCSIRNENSVTVRIWKSGTRIASRSEQSPLRQDSSRCGNAR